MLLVAVAALGLITGSFINAYVWRVHNAMDSGVKDKAKKEEELPTSALRGRSICPDCRHQLTAVDLVPVLSWLYLKGRCRYCREPISWQYPAVELLTAAAFTAAFWWWPLPLLSILDVVLLAVFFAITGMIIALAVFDLRWYLLPDTMIIKLLVMVTVFHGLAAFSGADLSEWLIQPLIGGAGAFTLFYLLHIAGKGRWMGGGDVKLVFALGLLAGALGAAVGLFVAFLSAAFIGVALMMAGKKGRRDMLPFGPFLLAGFWLAFFFAEELTDWYITLLTPGS